MQTLEPLAFLLRIFSHPLRLRILDFLETSGSPQRVTEIVEAAEGAPQAIISQQLKILRESGLLEAERRGNSVYYSVASPQALSLLCCVRTLAQSES